MAARQSRVEISIPTASSDGVFYGRYPKGDKIIGGGPMGTQGAARMLNQGTFGATLATITSASTQTIAAWATAQAAITPTSLVTTINSAPSQLNGNTFTSWSNMAVNGPDALRQRVAFALSEIIVVGGKFDGLPYENCYHYDVLVNGALGSFRTLIQNATLTVAMGQWLSAFRNSKGDPVAGTHADENYAREVMQLFTVGLNMLNPDGSYQMSGGQPIPTYDQPTVEQTAKVFTGLGSAPDGHTGDAAYLNDLDYTKPMQMYDNFHDMTAKTIIGGQVLAAGRTGLQDLNDTLDALCNHQNVGPFIGGQLIQKLVTSNPSPAYISRISAVWANDGSGNRGNLLAVITAILSDSEALASTGNTYGKLREPLVTSIGVWRAFSAVNWTETFSADGFVCNNWLYSFLEAPMWSPSVFNFFRPDYIQSGAMATAGLVAPEFQITNEYTYPTKLNLMLYQATAWINSAAHTNLIDGNQTATNTSCLLQTASWESLAATNVSGFVDQLALVLTANTLPTAARTILITYANTISTALPGQRVGLTLCALLHSPHFQVQT